MRIMVQSMRVSTPPDS